MNQNGRAGVVLPHGVLFRGGAEARIREQIINNDLIEAVISLPSKLFYGTGIPAAILIFNKNKAENRKNKVIIINAELNYLEGKNQNSLRTQDIDQIIKTFDAYSDIEKYSRVVNVNEILDNDYSLNITQYISTQKDEKEIDVKTAKNEIDILKKELDEIDKKVEGYLSELNY